jgi:carbamoyltransferase
VGGAGVIAGISGYQRNGAVAVGSNGRLAAVCEQGRVIRVRDIGLKQTGFPSEALSAAMRAAGSAVRDVSAYVVAEDELDGLSQDVRRIDHHLGHAATAFLSSPCAEAIVLVCDTHGDGVSLWRGRGGTLEPIPIGWQGPGFAAVYSRLTALLGYEPGRDEYKVEALARFGTGSGVRMVVDALDYVDCRLTVSPKFDEYILGAADSTGLGQRAEVAGALQRRLGELLLSFLRDMKRRTSAEALCLGGGLFFNTYLNTVLRQSGLFSEVYVPVNPGNAGVAAGCVLIDGPATRLPIAATPFLGPEYSNEEIKAILDNCKLSYEFLDDSQIVRRSVEAPIRGELVGWFRGRLEWGTRALGNRSIFANPLAPYVLENVNRFLKHRDPHRAFGVMARRTDAETYFEGPPSSSYMEYEYAVRDPELFEQILPTGIRHLRVQTVDGGQTLAPDLLRSFGEATGTPVLVNTSFNGFHEPIVCSPRDAVRVFYGTGLDLLVIGNFVLRK